MEQPWMFPLLCLSEDVLKGLLLSVMSHQTKQFENRVMNYLVNNAGNYSG